jgi:AcrR family transcriptional regulator
MALGRENVLNAARHEFAARGYAATSTRNICDRAKVTAPTLYHHFGNKAGVYAAVVEQLNDRIITAFERAIEGIDSYAERVVAIVEASREVQRTEPDIAQFVLSSQQDVARHKELARVKPAMSRLARFAASVGPRRSDSSVVLMVIFGLARLAVVQSPREYRASTDAVIAMVRAGLAK